jgi:hypothetical protein
MKIAVLDMSTYRTADSKCRGPGLAVEGHRGLVAGTAVVHHDPVAAAVDTAAQPPPEGVALLGVVGRA